MVVLRMRIAATQVEVEECSWPSSMTNGRCFRGFGLGHCYHS